MKILFISHSGYNIGGAEKCLESLLKGIKVIHPDWKLYLALPPAQAEYDLLDSCRQYLSGYHILSLRQWVCSPDNSMSVKLSFLYHVFRKVLNLCFFIVRIRPDCCVTNTIMIPQLAIAGKIMRIPQYWFIHEIPELSWGTEFLLGDIRTYRYIDNLSKKIFVPSDFARRFYADRLPNKDKLVTILQSIELNLTDCNMATESDRYRILSIGTMDFNKNQIELIEAINILVNAGCDNIQCVIVGWDGGSGMKALCEDYIARNALSRYVKIEPFSENIAEYYRNTDILVSCSKIETFGRTIAEARMCGLPVVAADSEAAKEQIMDGVDGLLYCSGDVNDLADKIKMLVNVEERRRLSDNIPADIQNRFSPARFASDFCGYLTTR